ncbi:MAG: DNA alkylation repair protein [Bacteroidota bacterium]
MKPTEYLKNIKIIFQENGNPEVAEGQMKYMRHKFEYYGLKAPTWMGLLKTEFKEKGIYTGEELKEFVRLCMADEYREINYAGLQMLEKKMKKNPSAFIDFYEELILTKSWWDTVDWVRKFVGVHFQKYPELILPTTQKWMASDNIWLQRICLIFQLTYKDKTDFKLMQKYILELAHSDEFFIQKGAGWALRQYSKFNAEGVIGFIGSHPELKPLTKREGVKWLKNQGLI